MIFFSFWQRAWRVEGRSKTINITVWSTFSTSTQKYLASIPPSLRSISEVLCIISYLLNQEGTFKEILDQRFFFFPFPWQILVPRQIYTFSHLHIILMAYSLWQSLGKLGIITFILQMQLGYWGGSMKLEYTAFEVNGSSSLICTAFLKFES